MYIQFEDDRTKVWIVVGITKLHVSLGFKDSDYADYAIGDFLESKDVEIQQRCIEYKQLRERFGEYATDLCLRTPLTD